MEDPGKKSQDGDVSLQVKSSRKAVDKYQKI